MAFKTYFDQVGHLLLDPVEELNEVDIESMDLEAKAIIAAQEKRYDDALNLFGRAIEVTPARASLYNNRAQTMRLLNDDTGERSEEECLVKLRTVSRCDEPFQVYEAPGRRNAI